jgi:hypothetical protein
MRTVLLLLAIFAASALANAQTVWKWVDEHGVTHYSDRPVPGATKMELSAGSSSTTTIATPPPGSSAPPRERPQRGQAGPLYQTLAIASPTSGESIINTGGLVQVSIRLEPALQSDHELHVYLDGRRIESDVRNATEYSLTEIPRGEHMLVAAVTDRRGHRVQESERVTFYVRQTSIANPPVGPALRNPPSPRPRP